MTHTDRSENGRFGAVREAKRAPQKLRRMYAGIVIPALMLFCFIAILSSAMLSFTAATIEMRNTPLFQQMSQGKKVQEVPLLLAIRDYESNSSWRRDGRAYAHYARLLCHFSEVSNNQNAAGVYRSRCLEAYGEALQREAGLPFAAYDFAETLSNARRYNDDLNRAYKQSVHAGPALPTLIRARAQLGLRIWPVLDDAGQAMVIDQIARHVEQRGQGLRPEESLLQIVTDELTASPAQQQLLQTLIGRL